MRRVLFFLAALVLFGVVLPWHYAVERQMAAAYYDRAAARRPITEASLKVAPRLDRRLVRVSGALTAGMGALDADFGIARPVLCLVRVVERCQWEERRGTDPEGRPTVDYRKVWSEPQLPSEAFVDRSRQNPSVSTIASQVNWGLPVMLGPRRLPLQLVEQLLPGQPFALLPEDVGKMPAPLRAKLRLYRGALYTGSEPSNPAIGDLRIHFASIPVGTVTVLGQQAGDTLIPPETSKTAGLFLIRRGELPIETMLGMELPARSVNILRLRFFLGCVYAAGFLLLYAAGSRERRASGWIRRNLGWDAQGLMLSLPLILLPAVSALAHFNGDRGQGLESAARFLGWGLLGLLMLGLLALWGWMWRPVRR